MHTGAAEFGENLQSLTCVPHGAMHSNDLPSASRILPERWTA